MSKNLKLIHTEKDEFSKPVKYYTDENNFLYKTKMKKKQEEPIQTIKF